MTRFPNALSLASLVLAAAGCAATAPPAASPDTNANASRPTESASPTVASSESASSTPAPSTAAAPAPADAPTKAAPAATPVANAAPAFTLTDVDGVSHSLADYRGKWVVLEWTNPGCPYVRKHYDTNNMQTLQKRATDDGAVWLTICSSAPGKEGNAAPAEWKSRMSAEKWASSSVLIDDDGKVGHLYQAKTTPHMYVIDPAGALVYRGAIDDKPSARKTDIATAKNYVMEALDAGRAGRAQPVTETKAYG